MLTRARSCSSEHLPMPPGTAPCRPIVPRIWDEIWDAPSIGGATSLCKELSDRDYPRRPHHDLEYYNGTHGRGRARVAARGRVSLTRAELNRLFRTLRALIAGTDELDANRAYAVDIAIVLTRAIERSEGGS